MRLYKQKNLRTKTFLLVVQRMKWHAIIFNEKIMVILNDYNNTRKSLKM